MLRLCKSHLNMTSFFELAVLVVRPIFSFAKLALKSYLTGAVRTLKLENVDSQPAVILFRVISFKIFLAKLYDFLEMCTGPLTFII